MEIFRSENGFTIIETMVAIFILAVGTLGVVSMLYIHMTCDGHAARTRRAESLCMQKLEELKTQAGTLTTGTYTSADLSQKWPDPSFVGKWEVSIYQWLDNGQNSGLNQIDITVGWPVGGACTASAPTNCKNKLAVTTYVKPLPGP